MEEIAASMDNETIHIGRWRGHLHFLIGLPRSGKSTWATNWMRGTPSVRNGIVYPRVVVCADDIRLAIIGERFWAPAEPAVHMVKDYMTEALLARGHDVCIDGTHTTEPSIRQNYQTDPNASWTFINTPVAACKERAVATNQSDLVDVINRMEKQLANLQATGLPQTLARIQEEVRDKRCPTR
jgi:predicted kinase